MNVNAYVDGFNLYGGGAELAGQQAGWKWLDIRRLAQTLANELWPARDPEVRRVVYCTTLVHPLVNDPDGPKRQEAFINALREHRAVDTVEYGRFLEKVKTAVGASVDVRRLRRPPDAELRWRPRATGGLVTAAIAYAIICA